MALESVISIDSASIKYGFGATREVGFDMRELGGQRVMVVTDPSLAQEEPVAVALDALRKEGIDAVLFTDVRIEPTDSSLRMRFVLRLKAVLMDLWE